MQMETFLFLAKYKTIQPFARRFLRGFPSFRKYEEEEGKGK